MVQFVYREETYCFPRQTRGPRLNGCRTSFLSFSKIGSDPTQRSGMNLSGKTKLDSEW